MATSWLTGTVVALGLVPSLGCEAKPTEQEVRAFAQWLGPQTNAVHPLYNGRDGRLDRWEVELKVVSGNGLELPATRNTVLTFDGANQVLFDAGGIESSAKYLVAGAQLKTELGHNLYDLNLRITSGPLAGAVVRLRNGRICESMKDPFAAVYRIPNTVKISSGPVPFEVINFIAK